MARDSFFIAILGWMLVHSTAQANLKESIRTVREVQNLGEGNEKAAAAWKVIAAEPVRSIPSILEGMNGANQLALNYFRSAVEVIVQKADGKTLPLPSIEKFLLRTSHHPSARSLAFDLIRQSDPSKAVRLLERMTNDPAPPLRREAVQRLIVQSTNLPATDRTRSVAMLQTALRSAREVDQIDLIAKQLKERGQTVDLPRVFGWVSNWKVIGPFDNTKGTGFERVYPPEEGVDLTAEYDGKETKAKWHDLNAKGDYGTVDLNVPFGSLKGVTGYAVAEFMVPKATRAEIRIGTQNSWKVWLNDKFLFGRNEYHRGTEMDQYRIPCQLLSGKNRILVKLCQNEQVEDWTKTWEFQLRLTDTLGSPLLFTK